VSINDDVDRCVSSFVNIKCLDDNATNDNSRGIIRVIIPREDILNVVTLLGGPMSSFDALLGPNKFARPMPPTMLSLY